ncbi:signal peptide peptidase-like 2B isoform X2 [Dermacentor albipictus]|uniref:signal peptide peptidase-like 2B isoform X2 n=1 Tax=Dermacentor albipictus TaxID=60249 RepID=UPI0038FC5BEA
MRIYKQLEQFFDYITIQVRHSKLIANSNRYMSDAAGSSIEELNPPTSGESSTSASRPAALNSNGETPRQGKSGKLGVVRVMRNETFSFCLKYFPSFKALPEDKSEAEARQLVDMTAQNGCLPLRKINLTDKVALIRDLGQCPLETVAKNFREVKAYGLVVGLSGSKLDDVVYDRQSPEPLDIVVGFVNRRSLGKLMKLMTPKEPLLTQLFTKEPEVDKGLLIVWSIATFSVAMGALWAGVISHQLYRYQAYKASRPAAAAEESQHEGRRASVDENGEVMKKPEEIDIEEDIDLQFTPKAMVLFVAFMCGALIVLYLFIQYLVYVIIGMFVLASTVALIGVLEPLFYMLPFGTARLPNYAFPCFYGSLEVRQVFLILFSIGLAFSWVVIRHNSKSWLLQDFLGVVFSIYMIKTLRLPNLMKSTPHNQTGSFAKSSGKGDSIMVEVARGGGSDEQIPMVMRVPHLSNEDIGACFGEYSVLGFGDILIPGFLVAYVHSFDLIASQGCLYYVTSVTAYGAGLVVTFIGLYVMKMAQPALLYLVPATLIPVILVAWCRGELREIWYGIKLETPFPSEEEPEPPADSFKRRRSQDDEAQRGPPRPAAAAATEPPPQLPVPPQRSALFPVHRFAQPAPHVPASPLFHVPARYF